MVSKTLVCPFIKRAITIHKLWLENLKRLDIPKNEFKLLFVDVSNDLEVKNLFQNYIKEHGTEWAKVEYIDNPEKVEPVTDKDPFNRDGAYLIRRRSIAETMDICNKHREGDMLLWEDDTIVPSDAYKRLLEGFTDDVFIASGVQYARNEDWDNGTVMLMWDLLNGHEVQVRHYSDEKQSGWDRVVAISTGFALIKKELLDVHDYHSENELGQDIVLSKHAYYMGKKVMVNWDLKFAHIGIAENGRFKVFRSPMCQTEVIDADGTKY